MPSEVSVITVLSRWNLVGLFFCGQFIGLGSFGITVLGRVSLEFRRYGPAKCRLNRNLIVGRCNGKPIMIADFDWLFVCKYLN